MRTSHNLYGLSYGKPSVPFFELYAFLKTFLRKVRTYCPSAMRVLEDQARRMPFCAGFVELKWSSRPWTWLEQLNEKTLGFLVYQPQSIIVSL
jgi:hypothetical protein